MDATEKINSLRKKIDKLDDRMFDLVLQRFSIAKEIGDIKKTSGIKIIDLHRESQIINRFAEKLAGTLEKNDITAIFDPIYSISKRLQKNQNSTSNQNLNCIKSFAMEYVYEQKFTRRYFYFNNGGVL